MTEPAVTPEDRLRGADPAAAAGVFASFRDRLKKMIRLDRRLQGRLDASDVLQDAFIEVQRKLPDFAQKEMPAYLWLRLVPAERLLILYRRHLGAQMRDAGQEVSLCADAPPASTHSLANLLLGRLTSPTQTAIRADRQLRLQEALNGMAPLDREVLVLRHCEALSNSEAATVLGLTKTAASNRYIRARAAQRDFHRPSGRPTDVTSLTVFSAAPNRRITRTRRF